MSVAETDLVAYLDGELDAAAASGVERGLREDPAALQDFLALVRADRAARIYFHTIDKRPLPTGVLDVLERFSEEKSTDAVVPFIGASPRRAAWHLPLAASVALVVGLGSGLTLAPTPAPAPTSANAAGDFALEQSSGIIAAGHPLYDALETTASGQTVALDEKASHFATPVRTVETRDGVYCREFELSGPQSLSRGAACRQASGNWIITVQTTAPVSNPDGTFQTASDMLAPVITIFFDDTALVDDRDEAQLLKNGWKQD